MNFRRIILALFVLALCAGGAWAQPPVVDPGWETFVIRNSSVGDVSPVIQYNAGPPDNSIEFQVPLGGQKAGLATNLINGATMAQIATLHIDRIDPYVVDYPYGPYFNIWVTDGLGNYAVIANEPSNGEWLGDPWDVADWDDLRTKTCKVYETPGWNTNSSWVHTHVGHSDPLTFEDVADLVIAPPPVSYITNPVNGVGSGAPDELGTHIAYGYTWVFGDTASNYLGGYVVNGYSATANFPVQNVTQATQYSTIEAALADANPGDTITVADGDYYPPNSLSIAQSVTLVGESEAGVIIHIPAAGSYGMRVTASDVWLENFTLLCDEDNENYPIHASGTSNPPSGFDNLTIINATISGAHRRAGFDVHGYNHVLLSNLTSSDAWGGNGLQVTGCVDVDIDNITTSDNAWGSIAIYCSNTSYLSRGSSDIRISGDTLNLGEKNLFSQDEFGFFNTGIVVSGYEYIVRNMNYRPDAAGFTMFQDTFADASVLALGLEGVAVGSYILTIADGNATVIPGITIQAAVGGVASGSTINVEPGLYVEAGQIVIDKDLSIIGDIATRPVIMTDSSTGASGNSRGWFLQMPGTYLVMRNLELDGSGYSIYQGLRAQEGGEMTNCAWRNIVFPGYSGVAIAAFSTYGNWAVTNCTFDNIGRIGMLAFGPGISNSTFSGNTYTGKGVGDWLDYGLEVGGGAVVTAENNNITACQGVASSDGSTSGAVLVTTFYGAGSTATLNGNTLTGNTTGVTVGYDASDVSVVVGRGNDLSGNDSFGVSNSAPNTVDFISNWWGSASGPYHATLNPLGTGVPVEDYILFDPWSGIAGGSIDPAATGPLNCSETITLTFNFTADEYTPDMFLYNAVVSATPGLIFGMIEDLEPFGTVNNNFFSMSTGANQWTITGSTVGNPSFPVSGAGTTGLFTITFSATSDVIGSVVFDSLTLRDPDNNTIPVDLSEATITYDCTAPDPVTNITAAPHHNQVEVGWDHAGELGDTYWIYQGLWDNGTLTETAYPEYDDIPGNHIPARPMAGLPDPLEGWVKVDGAPGAPVEFPADSFFDVMVEIPDDLQRGVYYYEVYAVDEAGNVSAPAAANDRATNYWLGDIDGDGNVDPLTDMTALGTAFGEVEGDPFYNNYCDVGRTDDWSRLGIPLTDNEINFEDLMVFSMNFGVVSPTAKSETNISGDAHLAWVNYGDNRYALRLIESEGLKGVHLRANLPEGASVDVTAGDLLDQQSEMTFLKNIGTGLDVSLAVTGVDIGFEGQGDLFIVESSVELLIEDLNLELRGSDNSKIEVELDSESGVYTPRVFALNSNYPNPFNPMTKISFSLPEAQPVRLNVYGIDGALVKTLINETRGSGLHEVLWDGCNDAGQVQASGLYFYRIEAGPYSQVRKMTLMK